MQIARQHFHDSLAGKFILTAGLGGMGGAQPLAGVMAGAAILVIEADPARIAKRLENGYLQKEAATLDEALALIDAARARAKRFPSDFAATPLTFTRSWSRAASPRTSSPTKPRRTIWFTATSRRG